MESFEAALDPLHVRSRWGIPALATKDSSAKPRKSRAYHVESLQWRALVDCNRSEGAMARRARQAGSRRRPDLDHLREVQRADLAALEARLTRSSAAWSLYLCLRD